MNLKKVSINNNSLGFRGNMVPDKAVAPNKKFSHKHAILDFRFNPETPYGNSYEFAESFYYGLFSSNPVRAGIINEHRPQTIFSPGGKCIFDSRKSVINLVANEGEDALNVSVLTDKTSFEFSIDKNTKRFKNVLGIVEKFLEKIMIEENTIIPKTNPCKEDFFEASAFLLKQISKIK